MKLFRIVFLLVLVTQSCSKDDAPKVNKVIDFGEVTEALFEQSDTFEIYEDGSRQQLFRFKVTGYSTFDIIIKDFDGSFYLTDLTRDESITHNGGVLGGGKNYITFDDSFEYATELHEGEYEFGIRPNNSTGADGTYELSIDNINELKPYGDLGIITLPFNESFIPEPERAGRTIRDFEISEDADWKIFVNRYDYIESAREQAILYDGEGEIVFAKRGRNSSHERVLVLPKGKYTLFFDSVTTLILGNSEIGDQDLGEISSFPFSQELSIDFSYETDSEQFIYFQTTEPSNLELSAINPNWHNFLLSNADGTFSIDLFFGSEILPAGSYYFKVTPSSNAYVGSPSNYKTSLYSPLIGTYNLQLTSAN